MTLTDCTINSIIGAKVKVISTSADNFFRRLDNGKEYTIAEMKVRVSEEGLMYPMVELEEIKGYFLFKDLQLISYGCGKK